ncbi:pentapeptide repeat-containing protein [Streptosporangium sp. CA-135522]|uniref:pentapeptide repeat-containing protein n=1 Tax=Streptosporangium sp. CA-135522 TaxID=3240072 RepID=UPI003D8B8D22
MAWWLLTNLPVSPALPPIRDPAAVVNARNEVIRTALAAAAGVGAAITLALAFRRQRHTEIVADRTEHDASERRVTELYTKAAEQLGKDDAPVRLAGLYALERLAQDTPALRQTIVDLICSYLRMPYTPPQEPDRHDKIRAARRAARTRSTTPTDGSKRDPREEAQVRLTAQRILSAHLRYQPPDRRHWWQRGGPDPNSRYWPGTRLDLTGATLIDFNLCDCRMSNAVFSGTTFIGDTLFVGTTFARGAAFFSATFTRSVLFTGATFTDVAAFRDATFMQEAWFGGATFTRDAEFSNATFTCGAQFDQVTFTRDAAFEGAAFAGRARFPDASFTRSARFSGATFTSGAMFTGVTFTGGVLFDETTGLESAELSGVRLSSMAGEMTREWPPTWKVAVDTDGLQTVSMATALDEASAIKA